MRLERAGSSGSSRYHSLDLWRGVACLAVVVFHATVYAVREPPFALAGGLGHLLLTWASAGSHGVTVFFVISGYCISATAEATYQKGRGLPEYFRRRVRRIFPPYLAALTLTALFLMLAGSLRLDWIWTEQVQGMSVTSVIAHPSSLDRWQWLGNLTLTETWRWHVVSGSSVRWILGQAWTLCYEEQFYLVAGLLLFTARRSFRLFFVGALAVTALTLAVSGLPSVAGTFLDGAWLLFATGIFVYYELNHARWLTRASRAVRAVMAALTCPIVIYLCYVGGDSQVGVAFALLMLLLHPWDRSMMASPLSRPFQYCGVMCYSLYLVHWPIAKGISHAFHVAGVTSIWGTLLVVVPSVVLATFGVAIPFHRHIERRFLNRLPGLERGGPPDDEPVSREPATISNVMATAKPNGAVLNQL
jgi:peptidoglycan/LPS O-acetylase OafA/YrhL